MCEHDFCFLRQDEHQGKVGKKPYVELVDVFFCRRCLTYGTVHAETLWPKGRPRAVSEYERNRLAEFRLNPDGTRAKVADFGNSLAVTLFRLRADEQPDREVIAEYLKASAAVLRVGVQCGLNPDDHFAALIQARQICHMKGE
jgi:hypothetical protein